MGVSEIEPTQQAQNAASALKTIVDIAAVHPEFKQAGTNLAKSTRTITELIDNCLLPIAAVNYAFKKARNYFEGSFAEDLREKISSIPDEEIVEPKASIVAPALQGLAFSHEEKELRDMYLNLLGSAMDARKQTSAHPAFSEIIRQLTSSEAKLFTMMTNEGGTFSLVELRYQLREGDGYNVAYRHLMNVIDARTGKHVVDIPVSSMIDNMARLGLITIDYMSFVVGENRYGWVESHPTYLNILAEVPVGRSLEIQKGVIELTDFGRAFSAAVTHEATETTP